LRRLPFLGFIGIYQAAGLALVEAVCIKRHVLKAVGTKHRFIEARHTTVATMIMAMDLIHWLLTVRADSSRSIPESAHFGMELRRIVARKGLKL
jgi:hypothetical protein